MATLDRTRPSTEQSPRSDRAHALATALERYYDSVTQLAIALDTSRDTVRAWLHSPPGKPREEILLRAERLWLLTRMAKRYIAADRSIGEWTLAPHLGLSGETPAGVLVSEGKEGLGRLLDDMVTYAPSRPDLALDADDELIWEGVQEILGPQAVAQVEKILEGSELDATEDDLAQLDAFD